MRLKLIATAAAAALSFACAAPASATIITVTQTGVVSGGFDASGLFGVAGLSLNGLAYTATSTIDTSLGGYFHTGFQDDYTGGSVVGLTPPVTMTLTINGHTETVAGANLSQAGTFNNDTIHEVYQLAWDTASLPSAPSIHYIRLWAKSASVPAPAFLTDVPGGNLCATFEVCGGDFFFADSTVGGVHINDISASLVASSYVVTVPGAPVGGVPEPATWAMMICGFGLVGGALRRRAGVVAT